MARVLTEEQKAESKAARKAYMKEYHKKWYAANRDKVIANVAKFRHENPEIIAARKKAWARENK